MIFLLAIVVLLVIILIYNKNETFASLHKKSKKSKKSKSKKKAKSKKNPEDSKCNWRNTNYCIFKDYTPNGITCMSPYGSGSDNYVINNYDDNQLKNWLEALYYRNSGNIYGKTEADNVEDYVNRCKNFKDYNFLKELHLPKLKKLGGIGYDYGTLNQFYCNSNKDDKLTNIGVRSGAWADGMKLSCQSGKQQFFGGYGGGDRGSVGVSGNNLSITTSPAGTLCGVNGLNGSYCDNTYYTTCPHDYPNLKGMEIRSDSYMRKLIPICSN